MARHLFLVRHAEAENKALDQPDCERALTPAGIRQAQDIGNFMLLKNFVPELVHCSAAFRTKQTAALVAEVMKLSAEKILSYSKLYEASFSTMNDFICELNDSCSVAMIVGHNPTISQVAEYFTEAQQANMVPASVVALRFETDAWKEVCRANAELVFYYTPCKS